MFALAGMVKSLRNFIADSVTRLSSFINSSVVEDKTCNEDADWHDLGESEEKDTVLFDDSISFSRDIIDDGTGRDGAGDRAERIGGCLEKDKSAIGWISDVGESVVDKKIGNSAGDKDADEGGSIAKQKMGESHGNETLGDVQMSITGRTELGVAEQRNGRQMEGVRRIVDSRERSNSMEWNIRRAENTNYDVGRGNGSTLMRDKGWQGVNTAGSSRLLRNQSISHSMMGEGEMIKSRNTVIYRSTGTHNYPVVSHHADGAIQDRRAYVDSSAVQNDEITLSYREYEMIERRISFLEDELKRETSRNAHANTNHLLSALQEKDTKLSMLMDQINKLTANEHKYKLQIGTLEKDLTRADDRANAFKVMADEKVHSKMMENESLRDQLEFERSKNARMRGVLREKEGDVKKYAMMNVEMVEYFKFMVDENVI
ncbi:hypothetical protein VCUG_00495 [Vavraia culicis subsp. floridensis]|uniref:Uncharacterized protein n=1 Tax=Vavraia culicis (isolate floridensis) TaxID=948595 RepID=L2GXI5_VAVCU|nr:uncharacterized protein VCUG_00495 [Vavraia culicis subsp. floridensis]ELA48072.2 hypothetical protein VCUG_00495 [Vavraia culicis subsp. floridensis]